MKYFIHTTRLYFIFLQVIVFTLFLTPYSVAQFTCGTIASASGGQMKSSTCIDMDIDDVPIKTIRVSFHIFQKDDGSENIPDNATGNNYLDAVEWGMNNRMTNMPMFDYSTSSPYYQDSKVRYEVVAVHFWQNTTMWSKGDVNGNWNANGNDLYNFVMSQSIPYKNNSVHLLMPGNFGGDSTDWAGIACDIGCDEWSMALGAFSMYQHGPPGNRNHWDASKLWNHELGHNFKLYHTFSPSETCGDTPYCYKCGNNVMDYSDGGLQSTLTQCQLSTMHYWLENNPTVVKSGMPNYSISGQISWTGGNMALDNLNFLPDPEFEVNINAPGSSYYTWTKTYGNGTWSTNVSGSLANIEIAPSDDHMTFEVSTEANCYDLNESYAFYHFPALYKIYPNPMSSQLNIELDQDSYSSMSANNKQEVNEEWHQITIYRQDKKVIHRKKFNSGFSKYSLDVSPFDPGIYYILIQNPFTEVNFTIPKH